MPAPSLEQTAKIEAQFHERRSANFRNTDNLFGGLMLFQWVAGVVLALWIAPRTWTGSTSGMHIHVLAALLLGAAIIVFPIWLILTRPGETITRHVIAVGQMLTSALLIHLTGGRIESHFHIFGSIAFLALYRDWTVLVTATVTVALDHLLRGIFVPQSVYGVSSASYLRFVEHAGWVAFEVIFLARACRQSVAETWSICRKQVALEVANETLEWEAEEREGAQNALRISEERFQLVASATRDTIWDRDLHTDSVWRNENFESMTGFRGDELSPKLDWLLAHIHPEDREMVAGTLNWAIANGSEQWNSEYRFCRQDGSYASILDRGRIVRDPEGKAIRMVGAMTDLSLVRELQGAKEAAEAATRAKSEFLANMSHEIRTPLNGIIGMTQLALETQLDGEQQEYLLAVDQSAQALLSVINDVLDFSKIEARKLEFDAVRFNLRETIEDALKAVALGAHRKGLELACRIPAEVPTCFIGDPGRLRQILINLVGNAIKFTKTGEVIVQVNRESTSAGKVQLRFSVSDTGVGIPVEKQALIFEAFAQADSSVSREFGGTGLGLAISSALVKMMNGKISLQSEVGKGSTFSFTAVLPEATSIETASSNQSADTLEGLHVLVVDDNGTNRRILQEILNSWQMSSECVESGRAALIKLKIARNAGKPFNLVLTDAHMPDIDGFELALRMRQNEAEPPILMLTSDMQRGDGARCRELGIHNYLVKPIRQSDLFDAIASTLGARTLGKRASDQRIAENAESNTGPLYVLLAEDNSVNQKLAVTLLQKRGHRVKVVGNGLDAVSASQKENFDVILMDVQMPGMDGFRATAAIREREAGKAQTPIIALTAHAMNGDRERCLDAGMNEYVSKPIRSADLFQAIGAVVPQQESSPAVAIGSLFNLIELNERVGDDQALLRELVEMFSYEEKDLRVQMARAIERNDSQSLERAAHALKGSLSGFAPKIALDPAAALETIGRSGDLRGARLMFDRMAKELDVLLPAMDKLIKADAIKELACTAGKS